MPLHTINTHHEVRWRERGKHLAQWLTVLLLLLIFLHMHGWAQGLKTINGSSGPGGGVTTFNTRTGAIIPQLADYSAFFARLAHTHVWTDISNPPATYAPSAHTHLVADVTDFPTTWDWTAIANKPPNYQADWLTTVINKPAIPAAQIQSDWGQASNIALDFIKNKPSIPAAQVKSDWTASGTVAEILNKPTLGGAALLNVGAAAGTVAAGDDSRLTNARTPTAHASSHATGGSDVIANAIAAGNSGLMTGADKTKLDGIATGATVAPALSSTNPAMDGAVAAGVGTTTARADHVHASDTSRVPTTRTVAGKALSADITIACADLSDDGAGCTSALSSTNPAMNGTAAPGVGTTLARADHVHPTDTGRAASNAATTVNGQACALSGTCTVTAMPSLVCKVTTPAQSTALASPATACTFALATGTTYGLICDGMTTNASASNLPTLKISYAGTSSASNFQGQMYSTATADTVGNAAAGSTVVTSAATAYTAMPFRLNGYITTTSASNLTVVITSSGSFNSSIIAGSVCMVL